METESKERESSSEALLVAGFLWTHPNKERQFALALEDCIDARIRLLLPTNCEPRDCHEYQSELIAERDKLRAELAEMADIAHVEGKPAAYWYDRARRSEDEHSCTARELRSAKAELESLRSKPLEGELNEDFEMLHTHLTSSEVHEGDMLAALSRIEAALRAKGAQPTHQAAMLSPSDEVEVFIANLRGELCAQLGNTEERLRALAVVDLVATVRSVPAHGTFACPICGKDTPHAAAEHEPEGAQERAAQEWLANPRITSSLDAQHLSETCEVQLAAAPEPRPIVDASACYCSDYLSSGHPCPPGECPNVPPVTPAPELPRKVASGDDICARCGEPRRSHGACGKADNFACDSFVELIADAPEAGK